MAQIKVDDVAYEIPESFTLKEMRIVERYTDGHATGEGYEMSKLAATIHIAIARAKPAASFEEIEARVDLIEVTDLEAILADAESAGQSPPASSSSESNGSSSGDFAAPSDAIPESETRETFGSPDSAAFRSFHATSET